MDKVSWLGLAAFAAPAVALAIAAWVGERFFSRKSRRKR